MDVITHPLFLIALAALLSWGAARWWYRRKLTALRAMVARQWQPESDDMALGPDAALADESTAEDHDARGLPRQGLLFSGTRDYRYPPFVDTSPHAHDLGEDSATLGLPSGSALR
jgi:hypothetical protein